MGLKRLTQSVLENDGKYNFSERNYTLLLRGDVAQVKVVDNQIYEITLQDSFNVATHGNLSRA